MVRVYYIENGSAKLKKKTFKGRADANDWIVRLAGVVIQIVERDKVTYARGVVNPIWGIGK